MGFENINKVCARTTLSSWSRYGLRNWAEMEWKKRQIIEFSGPFSSNSKSVDEALNSSGTLKCFSSAWKTVPCRKAIAVRDNNLVSSSQFLLVAVEIASRYDVLQLDLNLICVSETPRKLLVFKLKSLIATSPAFIKHFFFATIIEIDEKRRAKSWIEKNRKHLRKNKVKVENVSLGLTSRPWRFLFFFCFP